MKSARKKWSGPGMLCFAGVFLASGFLLTSAQTVLEERLEFSLVEGVPPGSLVGRVRLKPGFTYRLNEKSQWFSFDAQTGEIRTIGELDREALDSDRLDLIIVGTSPAYFISVRITVEDQNDNSPRFPYPFQNVSVPESVRVGTQIAISSASDPDSGANGRISSYSIVSGNSERTFKLLSSKPDDGEPTVLLEIQQELDRESQSSFTLNISATDAGTPPRSGFLTLFLNVLDANDHAPQFSQSHYQVSVRETLPAGSQVAQVTASDLDTGGNGEILYYLGGRGTNDPGDAQFQIDSLTGVITTKVPRLSCPPRKHCSESEEASDSAQKSCGLLCIITVEAVDHGVPAQRGRAFVNVELIDENDHDPQILFRMYPEGVEVASVDESVSIGSVVAVVTVSDGDSGLNGQTTVEIEKGNELGHFVLKTSDPFSLLRVNAPLNLEQVPKYNLTVMARDFGDPPRFSRRFLPIFVRDSSEKPPVFDQTEYNASVSENARLNTYVIGVSVATVSDSASAGNIRYEIISGNDLGWFKITEETGLILTSSALDFEQETTVKLEIRAKQSRVGFASANAIVTIHIEDENDQVPIFERPAFTVETPDSVPIGSEIFVIRARDDDQGLGGKVRYSLKETKFASFFSISSSSGQLLLAKNLDRTETGSIFRIFAVAEDSSWPYHRSEAEIIINLTGGGIEAPVFNPTHFFFNVFIGASAGDKVGTIRSIDAGYPISYQLLNNPEKLFRIDENSGEIVLTGPAALLSGPTSLSVSARRVGAKRTSKASVTVFPLPGAKEDLIPRFSSINYDFSVIEDSSETGSGEKVIGSVSAVDFDESTRVEYLIQTGNEKSIFEIGRYSGELRKVQMLDRESQDYHLIEVVAVGRKGTAKVPVGVSVQDLNDNTPRFLSDQIVGDRAEAIILKDLPVGMPLFYATATDPDKEENGHVDYQLAGDEDRIFHIDNHTGAVTLKVPTFMIPKDSYALGVTASDRGKPPKSTLLSLTVRAESIRPFNEQPRHADYFLKEFIAENTPVNTKLRKLEIPIMKGRNVAFGTEHTSAQSAFAVSPDGWLYVQRKLDFETQHHFTLKIVAETEDQDNSLTAFKKEKSTIEVNFYLLDTNDKTPSCVQPAEFTLLENSPPFSVVGFVEATDLDSGLNGRVKYSLLNHRDEFIINSDSGEVRSLKVFDRELMIHSDGSNRISLEIEVEDMGVEPRKSRCKAVVIIADANDLQPVFSLDVYTGSVAENQDSVGSLILQVTATDNDEGKNGEIEYILKPSPSSRKFSLDSETGKLTLKSPLDREAEPNVVLEIIAKDQGNPPKTAKATALIAVRDANDETPKMLEYPRQSLNISEWLEVGSVITKITAKDKDAGQNGKVTFEIISGNINRAFEIDVKSGDIRLIKGLDFETVPAYTLTVSARDHGIPSLSASAPVVINILDENDNSPEIEGGQSAIGQVVENAPVGTPVLTVTATDQDSALNGRIKFGIKWQKPEVAFEIDPNSGVISSTKPLDREKIDSYSLRVVAMDTPLISADSRSSERTVAVLVTDANDYAPEFVGPAAATVEEGSPTGYPVGMLSARDLDNGLNSSVGFRIPDDGGPDFEESSQLFGVNPDGGLFLRRPLYSASKPIYRIPVLAFDQHSSPGGSEATGNRLTTRTEFAVITKGSPRVDIEFNSGNRASSEADYTFDVPEDLAVGMEIGRVSAATTSSRGASSMIEYYVTSTRERASQRIMNVMPVSVDRITGALKVSQGLDHETMGSSLILDVYAVNVLANGPQAIGCQVRINILDVNDETPVIEKSSLEMSVAENAPKGHLIGKVGASDADSGSTLRFNLADPDIGPFSLDAKSGELRIRELLDRETTDEYRLRIQVSDGELKSEADLEIEITDWNDNAPLFEMKDSDVEEPSFTFSVNENSPRNSFVGKIKAEDPDTGSNGKIEYYIDSPAEAKEVFTIDRSTGVLTVSGHLDHETQPLYILRVRATDKGNSPLSSFAQVFVNVIDLNDHQPQFKTGKQSIAVSEGLPIGSALTRLEVQDADLVSNVQFSIVAGDPWETFGVDQDGLVFLKKNLDRELTSSHRLTIRAYDEESHYESAFDASSGGASTTQLFITVEDVNDNAPVFISNELAGVSENSPIGTVVTILSASDPDVGMNASVEFHMDPSTAGTFSVDPVLGWLRVNKPLDREIKSQYNLTIWAEDRGSPRLRSRQDLTVNVLDEDDNVPRFINTSMQLSISEDTSVGTSLLQLSIEDKDIGENAAGQFWIVDGDPLEQFSVSSDSGILFVSKPLDYETTQTYNLTIGLASIHQSAQEPQDRCRILISIKDANDNVPFFPVNPYLIQVTENIPQPLPALIGRPNALDPDEGLNGKLSYSIIQGNTSLFSIDSMNANLMVSTNLDREFRSNYELLIHVSDAGTPRQTATGTVLVQILDLNDNAPQFEQPYYKGFIEENASIGTSVSRVKATDEDSQANSVIRYSIDNSAEMPFTVDPESGEISSTAELDREKRSEYVIQLRASDSGQGKPLSTVTEIIIQVEDENDNAPIIRTEPEIYVKNTLNAGDIVFPIDAKDIDVGENSVLRYSLSGEDSASFKINTELAAVEAAASLKFKETYSIIVTATDGNPASPKTSSAFITILPRSSHDFPVFKGGESFQSFTVSEAQTDTVIATLQARSPKQPPFNRITYSIAAGNALGGFWVDPVTGKLSTNQALDREKQERYEIWIQASDNSDTPRLASFARVQVTVTDENDNKPTFSKTVYHAEIVENRYPPVNVAEVKAVDHDDGVNSNIVYSLIAGNTLDSFKIHPSSGVISTVQSLDREKVSNFELIVEAKDGGQPPLSSTALVRIIVADQNDNSPKFTRLFTASVPEDAAVGTHIVQITSSDPDSEEFSNNTYYFSVNPTELFAIEPFSGNVTVNGPLDREAQKVHQLKVVTQDGSWRVETSLTIEVLDVNDNAPLFSEPKAYNFDVAELQPPLTTVGRVSAVDPDDGINAEVTYSFDTKSDLFRVNSLTGEIISLKPLGFIPERSSYKMTLLATDNGLPPMRGSIPVTFRVRRKNEEAPVFDEIPTAVALPRSAESGFTVFSAVAHDPDSENESSRPIIRLEGDRDALRAFKINQSSGAIITTAPTFSMLASTELTLIAEDQGFPVKSSTAQISIELTEDNLAAPKFQSVNKAAILRSIDDGAKITRVKATDSDEGMNGEIKYELGPHQEVPFAIDPTSGEIFLARNGGSQLESEYFIEVIARDLGNPPKQAATTVFVALTPSEDFVAKNIKKNKIYVPENSPTDAILRILDPLSSGQSYRITHGRRYFRIEKNFLKLISGLTFDFEAQRLYNVSWEKRNSKQEIVQSTAAEVIVTSINEYRPEFIQKKYSFSIEESLPVGTIIGAVQAIDKDQGPDGILYYLMEDESDEKKFSVDVRTGKIMVDSRLQPSTSTKFKIMVKNRIATPGWIDWCEVAIIIERSRQSFVQLKPSYSSQILENSAPGTGVITLNPGGANSEILFDIIGGNIRNTFSISNDTGNVQLAEILDREEQDTYQLKISMSKKELLLATTDVNVKVLDVNDNGPIIPLGGRTGKVMEGDPTGTSIMLLDAVDPDLDADSSRFRYRLLSQKYSSLFEVDERSGILTSKTVFDRELVSEYNLLLEVADSGNPPKKATSPIKIEIEDMNDVPSTEDRVTLRYVYHGTAVRGGIIGNIHPTDADIYGEYRCLFQGQTKSGFSIESDSCQLKSSVPLQPSEHTFSIRGTDGVHAWVHYEVNLSLESITTEQLEKLVFVEISGKESEILEAFMPNLVSLSSGAGRGKPVLTSVRSETKSRHVLSMYFLKDDGSVESGETSMAAVQAVLQNLQKQTKNDVLSVQFNPCDPTPCKNNGKCGVKTSVSQMERKEMRSLSHVFSFAPITRRYQCDCSPSFGGAQCEVKVDHCGNDPCHNGGTCKEGENGKPLCLCPPEFEGQFCELDRNECSHQSVNGKTGPCSNGGFCENRIGGYQCICLVGFTGHNCEQSIDHCTAEPCKNGGQCIKKSDGYECKCARGFSGRNCQIQAFGFDEDSYVELPSLEAHANLLTMEFATSISSGLLLYSYSLKEGTKDYVALDILDGKLRLSARLERQGQMNLMLPRRVDDGAWYQVQIEHRIQKLIITLVKCSESGEDCESCSLSDTNCRMTAHLPGISAIMVPGPSVYLGGVKHYSDLFSRPGQVSSFSFIGCIRGFELNGKTLSTVGIKSKRNLLDFCPRVADGPCKGSLEDVCGTGARSCIDQWHKPQCVCGSDYTAHHCDKANQPMGFNGGFIHYELSKLFWRKLLFRPVDGNTLVVSDDLLSTLGASRQKRAVQPIATPVPDAKIELDFRTTKTEGLLFFAASGENSFSLIDIINGTVRYSSKLGDGSTPVVEIRIPKNPIVSDGQWHRLVFNLLKDGREVELGLDGVTKRVEFPQSVHLFLGSRLVNMSIGGLHSQNDQTSLVRVKGVPVPSLLGCMKRFILNGQSQPPWNDQSEFVTAQQVGDIGTGCSGCVSPPCSLTPFSRGLGVKEGVIISVVFFVSLFILLAIVYFFKRRRDAKAKNPPSIEDHKVASRLSIVAHSGFNPDFNISSERPTLKREGNQSMSDSNSNLLCPLQHTQSRPTLSSRLSGSLLEQRSTQSGFVFQFPQNFSAGEGSYTNGLDTTADETLQNSAERYDLDNASSIAPSDIEVSHHYRDFRTVRAEDMNRHANNDIRFASPLSMVSKQMQYRNSPSSVKQLKAALRASPAGMESSEDFSQKSRSRPGSAHSARRSRRRKGTAGGAEAGSSGSRPRSRSRRSSSRGKGSLRELRKYQSNPTFQDDSSSSSSDSEKSYNRRQPSQILTPRILSRSPHAPPKCESSTERSEDDNSMVPSDLDLDKLRKPRRILGLPDDTETESEAGGPNAVPSSLAPFRPPRTIFPLSEDDSDIPSYLPAPQPPPRSFKNKPLSSISQSSPWFAEDPNKALSDNRHSDPTPHEVDLEAYV